MDLSRGCILLARSLDQSDIFQNEKWLKVWIWCLIQANHKEKNVPVNTGRSITVVKVQRGQFIFGRNKAAEKLRIKPSTVWFAMQKLEKLENLDMDINNHYTLVTIRDYDFYQNMENYVNKHVDNQLTGNQQPTDTTNTPNTPNTPEKEYSEDSNEFRLSQYLLNRIKKHSPNIKEPDLQKWSKESDYLLRLDNRNIEECRKLIKFIHGSDEMFFRNILSILKFRKRYDEIKVGYDIYISKKNRSGQQNNQSSTDQTNELLDRMKKKTQDETD
jgi:DNA-binding Lrp family transcriptional regulator